MTGVEDHMQHWYNPGRAEDTSGTSTAPLDLKDRRRPGRPADVPPALIPLLRGTFNPAVLQSCPANHELSEYDDPDHLRAAHGLAAGVFVSGVIWAALALPIWWFIS